MSGISIVTITNRPQQLLVLADQVCKQQFSGDLEHIIVLDGVEINLADVEKISQKYDQKNITLKIISKEADPERYLFEKLGSLRNTGIKAAKQPYVALWDDDNSWKSHHLQSLFDKLAAQEHQEKGAAHSWRTLWSNDSPYYVVENQYPWITNDSRRSATIFRLQSQAGILQPGDSIVRDQYAYGEDGQACCVDTNEWLIRRTVFDNSETVFSEKLSMDQKVFGYTDDHILGLRFIENNVAVVCTEEATLHYQLGGSSQNHCHRADITGPLCAEPPNELDILARIGLTNEAELLQQCSKDTLSADDIQTIQPSARVPLFPASVADIRDSTWAVTDEALQIFSDSPYAVDLKQNDTTALKNRAEGIHWQGMGEYLDPIIRMHLGLASAQPFSVIVFGSALWKKPDEEAPGDLDMVVVLEDPNDYRVNVGSPVNVIKCNGINDFMPDDFKLREKTLDLCVVGRGALLERSLHSGDLTNIAVWSSMSGICLRGNPLLQETSDYLMIQEIFVSLGFTMKHFFETQEVNPKVLNVIYRSWKSLQFLANKQGVVVEYLAKLGELDTRKAEQNSLSLTEFTQFASEVSQAARELSTVIKQKAVAQITVSRQTKPTLAAGFFASGEGETGNIKENGPGLGACSN